MILKIDRAIKLFSNDILIGKTLTLRNITCGYRVWIEDGLLHKGRVIGSITRSSLYMKMSNSGIYYR